MNAENLLNLGRDAMYVSRAELTSLVNSTLPKGDINSELAKTIQGKVDVYQKMVGTLYTAIIHDEIAKLLIEYKQIYNIV